MSHENPVLTLAAHHQHLEASFDDLLRAVQSDDPSDLRASFTDFARELRAHLAYERRVLLPGLERDAPHEAALLRRAQAEIEERLVSLEGRLDRQDLQPATVERFIADLRRHARREDEDIESWATSHRLADGWEIVAEGPAGTPAGEGLRKGG